MAFRDNNSILTLHTTIGTILAKFCRERTEHRMWSNGAGTLCVMYRDPAGNLIALVEEPGWGHTTVQMYRACDVNYPGRPSLGPRTIERFTEAA